MEYFIDAYLDIEKDVPPSLQEDIWYFVGMLNDEFNIILKCPTDVSIYKHYQTGGKSKSDKSGNAGPKIYLKSLFGKYSLKTLCDEYMYETVLSCIENIFQLRLVVKNDQGKYYKEHNQF